jgi:hypothetical protein
MINVRKSRFRRRACSSSSSQSSSTKGLRIDDDNDHDDDDEDGISFDGPHNLIVHRVYPAALMFFTTIFERFRLGIEAAR